MKKYYVGIDVHQATSVIVVLNGKGKFEMEMIVATKAETLRAFFKQLRGEVHVTFEEGTQATWLYDLLRPLVAKVGFRNSLCSGYRGETSKKECSTIAGISIAPVLNERHQAASLLWEANQCAELLTY